MTVICRYCISKLCKCDQKIKMERMEEDLNKLIDAMKALCDDYDLDSTGPLIERDVLKCFKNLNAKWDL